MVTKKTATNPFSSTGGPEKTAVRKITQPKNPVRRISQPKTAVAPLSQSAPAQRAVSAPTGFAGGGGGGGTYSTYSAPVAAPVAPQAKSWDQLNETEQADYLKGDATYTAQQASLEQELQNLMAELAMQRTNYNTDYTSALSNMGWSDELKAFDPNNLLGAYGASFQNQQNDFAGRGMLDSSAYANALTNLGTSFDKQKGDLDTSRGNFLRELETRETGAKNTREQDLQRARADAIARRAAREGLV